MSQQTCTECGRPVRVNKTRYGLRVSCEPCGLWSWDGKPLVSAAVHQARKRAHAVFDPIWQNAEIAYEGEDMSNRQKKKVRRRTRERAYEMLAYLTGMPEPECHMGEQTDLSKLERITQAAMTIDARDVRRWWKERNEEASYG